MKPSKVYLDTNAFRYFGMAFEKKILPIEIRDKILISPLSAYEVFAQLADHDQNEADLVLRQIHSLPNWTNPQHSGLLPWPDDALLAFLTQTPVLDNDFAKRMQDSFNVILWADSLDSLKEAAQKQKQAMDEFKERMAHDFKDMLDDFRAKQGKTGKKAKPVDITEFWFQGILKRAKVPASSKTMSEVQSLLSAYHEFEQSKLRTALLLPEYNPLSRKNQNDIIDAEQLIYLGDPSLCMLTADKGFKSKVEKSSQAARVIVAAVDDLRDAKKAEAALRNALGI